MKVFIVSLVLTTTSTIAFACPNLAGKFQCTNLARPTVSVLVENEQSVIGSVTTYEMWLNSAENAQYIADGASYTVTTPHYKETIASTCSGTSLIVNGNRVRFPSTDVATFKMILQETASGFDVDTQVTESGSTSYTQQNRFSCSRL